MAGRARGYWESPINILLQPADSVGAWRGKPGHGTKPQGSSYPGSRPRLLAWPCLLDKSPLRDKGDLSKSEPMDGSKHSPIIFRNPDFLRHAPTCVHPGFHSSVKSNNNNKSFRYSAVQTS